MKLEDLTDDDKRFLRTAVKFHPKNIRMMLAYVESNSGMRFADEKELENVFTQIYGMSPEKYYNKYFRR